MLSAVAVTGLGGCYLRAFSGLPGFGKQLEAAAAFVAIIAELLEQSLIVRQPAPPRQPQPASPPQPGETG